MTGVTFDKLYDNYNVLAEAKDKIAEHKKEYQEAIESTKGDDKEKKLATQIISKFFKYFPSLQSKAIEAVFDVCEDDDASIRIAAMKTLPIFCKDNKEFVPKIADILAQLLQLEDSQEYNVASSSLLQILKANPTTVIKCIFKQMLCPENLIREKCIKFLASKIKTLEKSVLTPEIEDVIIVEIRNLFKDVTGEEFIILMPLLLDTHLSHTTAGQLELINIVAEQVEMDKDFDPLDTENNQVDRLLTCVKFVLPYFSTKMESTKFVIYYCDQVLPQWDKISTLEQGDLLQLALLRQLAELSINCGKLDNPSLHVVNIFQKLKDYMPPPTDDVDVTNMPQLDFTVVECLLYSFHRLARQCPDFLTHDPQALKDFRARLTYFSRAAQACCKALNFEIKNKTLSEEDQSKKKIAPRLLGNINTLIKDLFYQPPKYQCTINLSFKVEEAARKRMQEQVSTTKRHAPITFDSNGANSTNIKQTRSNKSSEGLKLYTPPSGKFSNNFQIYSQGNRPRIPRGGSSRGRGIYRNWRN